jgi:hypothetical protein
MSKHRRKLPDLNLHVTYQNVKDGVVADPANCTFGQCALSREHGMDFYVDPDPENPRIWAEWTPRGTRDHHRADVVRRHADGRETRDEVLMVVSATDVAKKALFKRFPRRGMDFILTNHTVRANNKTGGDSAKPGETDEERQTRLDARRERNEELVRLREQGLAEPAKPRHHRVRARFGGKRYDQ